MELVEERPEQVANLVLLQQMMMMIMSCRESRVEWKGMAGKKVARPEHATDRKTEETGGRTGKGKESDEGEWEKEANEGSGRGEANLNGSSRPQTGGLVT